MAIKVLVGLSGGVDSAVAAYLLKKDGYDVSACFMRNWDAFANNDFLGNPTVNDNQCPQEKDYEDAKKVAEKLGIPFYRSDFIKEYWDDVFSYFLAEYKKGRTPNPDVFCNKYIKFDAFLKFAQSKGFEKIAMGHYAKKEVDANGLSILKKAHDSSKDQTYFLSKISQAQLASVLFPLGDIDKVEVRRIAHELNLEIADKKDSTGVCFIGERNFKKFLMNYLPSKDGDIIDIVTNKKIGTHSGVLYYTIGQRRGLGIGGINGLPASGWFAVKKDVEHNVLYVASGSENAHLFSNKVCVTDMSYISDSVPEKEFDCFVKFRYRQADIPCRVRVESESVITILSTSEKFKAVTPGQVAVLYKKDSTCLGGGIIDKVYQDDKLIS